MNTVLRNTLEICLKTIENKKKLKLIAVNNL